MTISVALPDEAATTDLGALLNAHRPRFGCVYLTGDLGAGKTTLVRGLLRAAGHIGAVRSPTYTLIEPYEWPSGAIYHLDLYRIADPDELEWIGLRELLDQGLLLVEWPSQGAGVLPAADLHIDLAVTGAGRTASISAPDARWDGLKKALAR